MIPGLLKPLSLYYNCPLLIVMHLGASDSTVTTTDEGRTNTCLKACQALLRIF